MAIKFGKNIAQGLLGNFSEYDLKKATEEYGKFLMEDEIIEKAFKLLRDALVITSKRLFFSDRQGLSGEKQRIISINLHSIYNVTVETAGSALDDSEITINYIKTPILNARTLEYDSHTFEFPKNFDVAELYRYFMTLAYNNVQTMNKL